MLLFDKGVVSIKKLFYFTSELLKEIPDKNFPPKSKQRRRKAKCSKNGNKCLKSRKPNKNIKKLNRLPKKFASSKVSETSSDELV